MTKAPAHVAAHGVVGKRTAHETIEARVLFSHVDDVVYANTRTARVDPSTTGLFAALEN